MDYTHLLLSFSILFTLIYLLKRRETGLPPGPRGFPIIGNLLELGKSPHRSLTNLSKTYGPIMSLKLGSLTTIVISSPEITKELFQKHDQVSSHRTTRDTIRSHNHHVFSMAWMEPTVQWRNLRKISNIYLFSTQRLDDSKTIRHEKVRQMIEYVGECCDSGKTVNIGVLGFITLLNSISYTAFSKDMAKYSSDASQEFKDLVWGTMEGAGTPNVSDYFPFLRFLDLQGAKRKIGVYFLKLFEIVDEIVDRRRQLRAPNTTDSKACNDVLDNLLNLNEETDSTLSLDLIKHFLLDLIVAGTDTTSSTLEWAMTELLRNPKILAKAQKEIQLVLSNQKEVQESDISNLPYLQAIIKETFRLHPPAPLAIPRRSKTTIELCGFNVPKNTQILLNIWAIGRDTNTWENPNSFMPERFLNKVIDVKGGNYELIPFGGGRRICPGLPFAYRMVHIMLASLLLSFKWGLEDGMKPEDLDMSDKFGLSLQKSRSLIALPFRV